MSDYKELYLTMFQACEEAIRRETAQETERKQEG